MKRIFAVLLLFVSTTAFAAGPALLGGGAPGGGGGTYVLKDSQLTVDTSADFGGGEYTVWAGTSFTAGSSYTLRRISLPLAKNGSPVFNVTFYIYNSAMNSLLGTSNIVNAATVPNGAGGKTNFDFSGVSLSSGTTYVIVGNTSAYDGSNTLWWDRAVSITGKNAYRDATFPPGVWVADSQFNFITYAVE